MQSCIVARLLSLSYCYCLCYCYCYCYCILFPDRVDFGDAELHHWLLVIVTLPIVRTPLLLNSHPIVDHAALSF